MRIIGLFTFVLSAFVVFGQEVNKDDVIQGIQTAFGDRATILPTNPEGDEDDKIRLTIRLSQPLDHDNPAAGRFDQVIYLTHVGQDHQTVLVTEGYEAYPGEYELTRLLDANQVQVEYRFYGSSRPDSIPWDYLTNDQAIEDYHFIVGRLKEALYPDAWISTGISKGGETVLIYKSRYPDDVDVAVPYVAPLIDTQEDPRTIQHQRTTGSEECRKAIREFQRIALMKRNEILRIAKSTEKQKGNKYTIIPLEEALEYAVLEYPFSFWQWGGVECEDIPGPNASAKDIYVQLNEVVGFSFYSDKTYDRLLPSYYQHMKELGYYGFDTEPVKDLLKVVKEPTNQRFAPKGVDLTYNPNYIKSVRDYVENQGHKILYIYGELDTWGACAPTPKPGVDALKMVLKGGSHKTRIRHFSEEDQNKIFDQLESWLGGGSVRRMMFR